MAQSFLSDPYRLMDEQDGAFQAEEEGLLQFDISWSNDLPIDADDYYAGDYQLIYELSLSCEGYDQPYIGSVIENPNRYQFGSYCFEREGFVEAGSREIIQYPKSRIIWKSELYRLSGNRAGRSRAIQLAKLPSAEMELQQELNLLSVGRAELIPHKVVQVGGENGWSGTWIDENQSDEFGRWFTQGDAELTISKQFPLLPTEPFSTNLSIEQLRYQLTEGLLELSELESDYNDDYVGTIDMYRERNKILITLYQGVACEFTLKIYQTGIYLPVPTLPIYPIPDNGGGGGGGGGA